MIEKGQKLVVKVNGTWALLEEPVEVIKIQKKLYKISFSLTLNPK